MHWVTLCLSFPLCSALFSSVLLCGGTPSSFISHRQIGWAQCQLSACPYFCCHGDALANISLAVALCQLSAQVYTSRSESFYRNDTLTVTCDVTNKEAETFYITWHRIVEGEEVEIGTSAHINDGFRNTKRYKADYHTDIPHDISHVKFHLNITDVTTADSGRIGCKIPTQGVVLYKPFTVYEPVKTVKLITTDINGTHAMVYSDGQSAKFKEDEVLKITCSVNGSYPAPRVKVTVAGLDITSKFARTETLHKVGATKGLQELYYEVLLTNEKMSIAYDFDQEQLKCEATMPETEFEANSISINISLTGYKPKFLCNPTVIAENHHSLMEINCTVRSQPPAYDFQITWNDGPSKSGASNTTLKGKDRDGHYSSDNVEGKSDLETVMVLTITRLFPQHFRTYYFEATNELGREVFPIELVMSDEGYKSSESRSNARHILSSIPLLLVAYILTCQL
ncbi:hypothetical protein CAPTEDRAFT_219353 [Capitella teleta]|uniref:Immunoglobulin domain-containing protein n=1 Tax=Capitella teleta TaxID=283909 RepID=R7U679_CAPTE|nr:hypothetical protein CAPTEDRAFT_219353 [Capitella teleta]|eukprot:ELU01464.1 hypothetical protein CAPTEDRAFT_219353 [Capitella teleta]